MLLRRFKPAGLERFRTFIATLQGDKTLPAPMEMLADDTYTEVVVPHTDCPDVTFADRLAAAKYLDKVLTAAGLSTAYNDVNLWSWLSLRFFDQVRPLGKKISIPQLSVSEYRYIPTDDYKTYYRHFLRHPLQVYHLVNRNGQLALCLLVQPVYRPGNFVEQFSAQQLHLRNPQIIGTLTDLFVDTKKMKIKAGSDKPLLRMEKVIQQFDCTWDLGYISKDLLMPMLPDEFDKFRNP